MSGLTFGNGEKKNALKRMGTYKGKPVYTQGDFRLIDQEEARLYSKDGLVSERHPSSQVFHDLLKEVGDLHDQKQGDYGRSNDPFANVRASEEWGIEGWIGAMVRAQDKVRRLQTFAQRGSLVNEPVRDSLLDLACYALIALVLYEEETNS